MVCDITGWCPAGFSLCFLAGVFFLVCPLRTDAHPAHAKPVNYPYVVGFERFHSSLDDDDYLAGGGLILLNELNCVSCHEPPRSLRHLLTGVEATNLKGVATRFDHINLELMIRNPRFVKRDTVMPSLFAGPDRDLKEVEALKQYLAAMIYEVPEYPRGDIEAGRSLYHRIGCAACHAPEVGYRPPGIPENAEIEMVGLPSVPMNLADLYDLNAITHFLLSPNEHRPSGRMPDFQLSTKEAANLAAYLKAGPDLQLPDNLTQALQGDEPFARDESLAKIGKELFQKKNCTACHTVPGEKKRTLHRATSLAKLPTDSEGGCFSERPRGGAIPFFGLDTVQKRAIRATLERIHEKNGMALPNLLDWRMKKLNCYACHERDGVGGSETSREVYFGFADDKAVEFGPWGNLPPMLDGVGARLTEDWLKGILSGRKGGVRSYQMARMPVYAGREIDPFPAAFRKYDFTPKERVPRDATAEKGRELFSEGGKNCVKCHQPDPDGVQTLPGINLQHAPDRLRFSWFRHAVVNPAETLHGAPMPDMFPDDESGKDDAAAIWKYLESLRD